MARLEIDFTKLLISVIHERDFKSSATYSFACMISSYAVMLECPSGTVMSFLLPSESWISVLLGMRPMWRHHNEGPEFICNH